MGNYNLVFCTLPEAVDESASRYVSGFDDIGGRLLVAGFELTPEGELHGICPMATVGSIEDGLSFLDSLQPPEFDSFD